MVGMEMGDDDHFGIGNNSFGWHGQLDDGVGRNASKGTHAVFVAQARIDEA
jgi:hypothetical protein